jgi:glycosyltransferase involved in cell wall biosynthesis
MILIAMPQGEIAGAETVLFELLKHTEPQRVAVAAPSNSPLADGVRDLGHRVVEFSLPKRSNVRSARAYASRIFNAYRQLDHAVAVTSPSAIHAFLPLTLKVVVPISWRRRLPVIASVHDVLSPEAIGRRRAAIQGMLLRRGAARVIAVSDYVRRLLLDAGMDPDGVVTVHNGVSVPTTLRSQGEARRELGLNSNAFVVAHVGRLTSWKGQDVAIEALTDLSRRRPDLGAQLLVVGSAFEASDHDYALAISDRAKLLGPLVTMSGFLSDPTIAYRAADVVLVSSTQPDPFPTVVLESGANARIVVVTSLGGGQEAIVDGTTGFIAAPNSTDIAGVLERIADMELDWRGRAEQAAAAHIGQNFSSQKYAARIHAQWALAIGA